MGTNTSALITLALECDSFEDFVELAYISKKKNCPYCDCKYPDTAKSGSYYPIRKKHYLICSKLTNIWRATHPNKKIADQVARLAAENARLRTKLKKQTVVPPSAPPQEGEKG